MLFDKVEVEGIEEEEVLMENDTNMLIYEKRETDELTVEPVKRKLSRKERIRLEKIVEKKEKTSRVRFYYLTLSILFSC